MQTININGAELLQLGETTLSSADNGKIYKMALTKDSVYEMQMKTDGNGYLRLVCFNEDGYREASASSSNVEYERTEVFALSEWGDTGDFVYFALVANGGSYTGTIKIEEFAQTLRVDKGSKLSHEEMDSNFMMAGRKRKIIEEKLDNNYYGTSDQAIYGNRIGGTVGVGQSGMGTSYPEISSDNNSVGELVMAEMKVMARPAGSSEAFVYIHTISIFRITDQFTFEELQSMNVADTHPYLDIMPAIYSDGNANRLALYKHTIAPEGETEVDMEIVGTINYSIDAESYQNKYYSVINEEEGGES